MTPGPFLLTSGAFILVAASAYDFYCDSITLDGYRRRKLQTYADTSPGSTFAKRLARHGLATDSDVGEPAEVVRVDVADVIEEIEAFHAWLISGYATGGDESGPGGKRNSGISSIVTAAI